MVVDPGGNLQSLAVMHWGLLWGKSYVTGLFVYGADPALSGVLLLMMGGKGWGGHCITHRGVGSQ